MISFAHRFSKEKINILFELDVIAKNKYIVEVVNDILESANYDILK